MDNDDYAKIKIDPIFEPIKKIFEFFILGSIFVSQKDFQKLILEAHPDLTSLINTYNQEVNLKVEGHRVKAEIGLYQTNIARLMAIAIFDILQFSKYHNKIKNSEIFKFAKHIRNGAAHDNKFDISPPIKNSIQWRDKTITNSLNNTKVIPDFIASVNLIFLMSDITALIEGKNRQNII